MHLFAIILIVIFNIIYINAQDYGGGDYGGYGGGYGGYKEKVLKPAVIKPPIIPFVKPVITSYQKFPIHGGYGGYGGYGGLYKGKVIPINKLHEYQPKFDLTQFVRPYEGAHLLQKYGKPEIIIKHAPPVFIKQPPIEKTIIQNVYVKQPVIVKEQPVIHKEKEIIIKKKPAIVRINEKAPVDVKDFGKTAIFKGIKPGVVEIPKDIGIEKGEGGGGGEGGGEGKGIGGEGKGYEGIGEGKGEEGGKGVGVEDYQ